MERAEKLATLLRTMIAPFVRPIEERLEQLESRPPPRDGAPGRDGRDGLPGRDSVGKDGRDGLSVEDFDLIYDGRRTITIKLANAEIMAERAIKIEGLLIWRGIYRDGEQYERGDMVTWAGAMWHANEDTGDKPGEGTKAWTLAVKRGRDGRDGTHGEKGDPGRDGRDGKDRLL